MYMTRLGRLWAHTKKNKDDHGHFVCPHCHGEGWLCEQPENEYEIDALNLYKENLEKQLQAVMNRLDELESD